MKSNLFIYKFLYINYEKKNIAIASEQLIFKKMYPVTSIAPELIIVFIYCDKIDKKKDFCL